MTALEAGPRLADGLGERSPALPLAALVRDRAALLRPAERRVAEHLLALDPLGGGATAAGVADTLGVSRATVVNAVQRLGYDGFGDFRRWLIAERAVAGERLPGASPAPDSSSEHAGPPALAAARRVFTQERAALDGTVAQLGEAFLRAVEIVSDAAHVLCIGAESSSALLSRLAAGMFTKCGVHATAEEHASEQRALVEVADTRTALLVTSYRGTNPQLVQVAQRARERGLRVIAMTNSPRSPLALAADVALLTAGPPLLGDEGPSRIGPRGAQLALARALAEAAGETRRQRQETSYARLAAGGS